MELRPYQHEAVALISGGFKNHQRQVLCLPTGAGKTVVFCDIIRRAAEKGTRTLILTDRIELFKQTFKALGRINITPQIISKDTKEYFNVPITVAMVETIARRLKKGWPIKAKLIIIDEAHKANFNKIIDCFPDAYVIGATATPVGKHFYHYYTDIVNNIDIPELVSKKFLLPCKAFQMVDDFSDVKVKGQEYEEKSLFNHYDKANIYDGVIDEYKRVAPGSKAMVFCVNVEHTIKTHMAFVASGLPAFMVHSKMTNSERISQISSFEACEAGIMVNCGILTTGYDHPPIETIIVNRATLSLPLWLQMTGRGSRPYGFQKHFTILDFGMNHDRHGRWDMPREWTLKPPKKKKAAGAAPVKTCPECTAMLHATQRECEYCGFIYPIQEKELKEGVLVEVPLPDHITGRKLSSLSIDELIELERTKKYKTSFIWRIIRSRGEIGVLEYAGKKSYKRGWISRQIEQIEQSNFADITLK